jgi:hypothetical protein
MCAAFGSALNISTPCERSDILCNTDHDQLSKHHKGGWTFFANQALALHALM